MGVSGTRCIPGPWSHQGMPPQRTAKSTVRYCTHSTCQELRNRAARTRDYGMVAPVCGGPRPCPPTSWPSLLCATPARGASPPWLPLEPHDDPVRLNKAPTVHTLRPCPPPRPQQPPFWPPHREQEAALASLQLASAVETGSLWAVELLSRSRLIAAAAPSAAPAALVNRR